MRLVRIAVLAAIYFFSAKAALLLAIPPGYATGIWPPSGIALAALLLFGTNMWPGIWLGAAITNFTIQGSPLLAVLIGTGNTLEALVAASFVGRHIGARGEFETGGAVFAFIGLSMLSAVTAAFIGSASLTLSGAIHPDEFTSNAWIWFQGDASGIMILTPLILLWARRPLPKLGLAKWVEALVLAAAIVMTTVLVFGEPGSDNTLERLTFLMFPFVIWIATRFDQRGVMTSIAIICGIAIYCTLRGEGYFAGESAPAISFYLLSYTGILVVTGLTLSVVIGQRRRAEDAVRQRVEELQENERHLNEFLAMLSHELRNPLAPIVNAIAIVRSDPAHSASVLGILDRQMAHLTHIVDDLLDVSRITRGKIRLQKVAASLNDIVLRAVESTRPMIEARKHRLELKLCEETVPIEADVTRIYQVILNLVNNAVKYTPSGGRIEISLRADESQAELRISDTGIGIAPELLSRIFDLFVQGDRGLDRSEGGLGIGLTIARRIVEMHGGTLAASSNGAGKGAEFVVRLPLASGLLHTIAAAEGSQPAASARYRMLVVDDNCDSADSLAAIESALGHDVRTAYSGRDAIELAKQFRPEIVLLDIGLPGMDGYEVARALRGFDEGSNMVIIAVSGYGQEEDRRLSREAGFDHHFVKPVRLEELNGLIASLPRQPFRERSP
ncbi:MAG TPA: MASE1 domain-containing protein [Burkholderiales bacterium]|nr:MASE1 domain-containing protein [Burkholderiales bacterium]